MDGQLKPEGLRARIREGAHLLGAFCPAPSPELIEIAAYAGFDFTVIDAEHGPITMTEVVQMIRAGHGAGTPVMVRVPELSPEFIMRALDSGADGIMVPQVETAEEVERIYKAMHYPPHGVRGLAFYARAHEFTRQSGPAAMERADASVVTAVLVETPKGVENIDAIMATQRLDLVLLGTGDLAANIGYGPTTQEEIARAIERVLAASRKHGVAAAIAVQSAEEATKYAGQGFQIAVTGMLPHLLRFCSTYVNAARAGMAAA